MQGTKSRSHTHMFVLLECTIGPGRLHGGGGKASRCILPPNLSR